MADDDDGSLTEDDIDALLSPQTKEASEEALELSDHTPSAPPMSPQLYPVLPADSAEVTPVKPMDSPAVTTPINSPAMMVKSRSDFNMQRVSCNQNY